MKLSLWTEALPTMSYPPSIFRRNCRREQTVRTNAEGISYGNQAVDGEIPPADLNVLDESHFVAGRFGQLLLRQLPFKPEGTDVHRDVSEDISRPAAHSTSRSRRMSAGPRTVCSLC